MEKRIGCAMESKSVRDGVIRREHAQVLIAERLPFLQAAGNRLGKVDRIYPPTIGVLQAQLLKVGFQIRTGCGSFPLRSFSANVSLYLAGSTVPGCRLAGPLDSDK